MSVQGAVENRDIEIFLLCFGPFWVAGGIVLIAARKRVMRAVLVEQRNVFGSLGTWMARRSNTGGNVFIAVGSIWILIGIAMTVSAAMQLAA